MAVSGTVNALATPTLSTNTSSLSAFTATQGTASGKKSFTVSGSDLTSNVIIDAPVGFEIANAGSSTYSTQLILIPTAGALSGVIIDIRVSASAAAAFYNTAVDISSTGAVTKQVAVTATVSAGGGSPIVLAKFNFNAFAQNITDWTDVSGDPNVAVRTATDARSGTGITVSSIATNLWTPTNGSTTTSTNAAGAIGSNSDFPAGAIRSYWYSLTAPSTTPNLKLSGFTPGASVTIKIMGSREATGVPLETRQVIYRITDANGTQSITNYNVKNNTSTIATFTNKVADANGDIYVVATSQGTADHPFAYINALIVEQ